MNSNQKSIQNKDTILLESEKPSIEKRTNQEIYNCVLREIMMGRGHQCIWKVTIKKDRDGIFKTFYRKTTENEGCYDNCVQGFKMDCDYYYPVIYLFKNKIITFEDIIKRKQEFKRKQEELYYQKGLIL